MLNPKPSDYCPTICGYDPDTSLLPSLSLKIFDEPEDIYPPDLVGRLIGTMPLTLDMLTAPEVSLHCLNSMTEVSDVEMTPDPIPEVPQTQPNENKFFISVTLHENHNENGNEQEKVWLFNNHPIHPQAIETLFTIAVVTAIRRMIDDNQPSNT